ncbi:hypothetical protein ACODRN_01455 [Leuconostoc mesenteroides]|uniref:hypothetical protein n=1 Tax=Leuconostoc mesenteroides TaxID=1245 RepID=UPI003B504D20
MAVDIMAIERTRLSLVNGSRNMSLMLDKLRSIDANEMANIRNIVKNIESSQEELDAYIKEFRKLV